MKSFCYKILYKVKFIWTVISLLVLYPLVVLFPRNHRKILFGAWWGRQFADNPKYFLKFLIEHNAPYEYYWIGNENIHHELNGWGDVHFVRKGSIAVIWHVLTAQWAVWNISFSADISDFPTFGRIKQLSFWHGPGFKGFAHASCKTDSLKSKTLASRFRDILLRFVKKARTQEALASFSTQRMVEFMKFEAPNSFRPERSRAFGSARIDYLIQNKDNEAEIQRVRDKYAKLLGLPQDKKWYLYMPTWRKGLDVKFSFLKSSHLTEFQEILEAQNAVIVEKQHPQVMSELGIKAQQNGNLYAISEHEAALSIDTQELLLACQRMITDYSSCSIDFMTMNRPVLYFMYDYEAYVHERGLMYSVEEVVAGPISRNEKQLIRDLTMSDNELLNIRGARADELREGETGNACEQFARWVGLSFEDNKCRIARS